MDYAATSRSTGLVLSEILLIVLVLCVIVFFALPPYVQFVQSEPQRNAVLFLKSVQACQGLFQKEALVDMDGNGIGRFGFFQELSGTMQQHFSSKPDTAGAQSNEGAFKPLRYDRMTDSGVVVHEGYCFRLFLPVRKAPDQSVEFLTESKGRLPETTRPGREAGEEMWMCYAWPLGFSARTDHAFYACQQGPVYHTQIDPDDALVYEGPDDGPAPDTLYAHAAAQIELPGQTPESVRGAGKTWLILK